MSTSQIRPDLLLINGLFHTQDPKQPKAEAVAIGNGRIVAVGKSDAILSLKEKESDIVDLKGKTVIPGMIDSHFHFHEWSFMRKQVDLASVNSFDECIERISDAASSKQKGDWILGQGFNESEWPENRMPLRSDLDAISTLHPIVIWRCDLHLAVANSVALKIAGIEKDTPDPPEGLIEKDKQGQPTGVLRELAINLVKESILELMEPSIIEAMKEGMPVLNALGLTGIHDIRLMGGLEGASALKAWQVLDKQSALTLRSWVTIPGERIDEAIALGLRSGFGNDKLKIGHLKFFADGGMGARTAYMIEPYLDAGHGMPLTSIDILEMALGKANRNDLAVMIHGIGDRTNRELIKLLEEVHSFTGRDEDAIPHRIEHLQMVRSEDIQHLAEMKQVVACVQPHNLVLDINMVEQSVGEKGKHVYAFRDMLDAGVQVIFSSDCPVCSPSPIVGIHAAVTRQRPDGTPREGWYPEQKVSVEEAVYAYTQAPATAGGMGDHLGSITPGKFADMVVLDQDIFSIPPQQILKTKVEMTLFDGKIVYSDSGSE